MASRAIVFAGQGAQAPGMGRELAERFPVCRALFERADRALGYSLSTLCFEGPDEELTRSNHCQPGIFVTSMACYAALRAVAPDLSVASMAGLSLGEWTALHAAGALTFEDALRALEARGRFMQEACLASDGGMVGLLGLSDAQAREIAAEADVELANVNSPEQIVLSGERAKIARAAQLAGEAGAKRTIALNVAGAFHSRLMQPAAERLAAVLESIPIRAPAVPVVSNVTARPHGDPDDIRRLLAAQVTQPVQWLGSIEWLKAQGIGQYVECGPGRVLSGLIKRIDGDVVLANVQDVDSLMRCSQTIAAS